GDGRAVGDLALGGSHFGGMQQSGNKCGFAALRMPHYSDVADLTSLVRFHSVLLHKAGFRLVLEAGKRVPRCLSLEKRMLSQREWERPVMENRDQGSGIMNHQGLAGARRRSRCFRKRNP